MTPDNELIAIKVCLKKPTISRRRLDHTEAFIPIVESAEQLKEEIEMGFGNLDDPRVVRNPNLPPVEMEKAMRLLEKERHDSKRAIDCHPCEIRFSETDILSICFDRSRFEAFGSGE